MCYFLSDVVKEGEFHLFTYQFPFSLLWLIRKDSETTLLLSDITNLSGKLTGLRQAVKKYTLGKGGWRVVASAKPSLR